MNTPVDPDSVPPIGFSPEGQDFAHPWIVSALVSGLCFAIGFALLYFSGWWAQILQWADLPFLVYFAILFPVLVGFTIYGVFVVLQKVLRKRR